MKKENVIEAIDRHMLYLRAVTSNGTKRYHYAKAVELITTYEEMQNYYTINDRALHYKDRIIKNTEERTTVIKVETKMEKYEIVDGKSEYNDRYDWQLSQEEFSGLYFIGEIGYNPILDCKIFMVKIGCSSNIKRRMATYRSDNPNFWHANCSLPVDERNMYEMEAMAHKVLHRMGRIHPNANEWFIVDEKDYYKLCALCSNQDTFYQLITQG